MKPVHLQRGRIILVVLWGSMRDNFTHEEKEIDSHE